MGKLYNFFRQYLKFFIIFIVVIVIALVWLGNKFFSSQPQPEQPAESTSKASPNQLTMNAQQENQAGIHTQTLTAASENISSVISLQGQALWSPNSKIMVTSPVSGIIQQIFVQPLADMQQANKIVAVYSPDIIQTQNEILQLRAQQQLYSQNLAREKKLFADGIIAEKRVQEARNQLQQINIDIEAKQRLLQFMGVSSTARLNPVVNVNSPAHGVIESLNVTAGQHVEKGTVIGQIIKRDMPLVLMLQTPMKNAERIRAGDTVSVEGCNIKGQVVKLSPSLVGNTQTQEIMVQMASSNSCLTVNQYVKAQIQSQVKTATSVWSVPNSAMTLRNGKNYIFIKQAHGFETVPVEVVSANAQTTYISGTNLKAGQAVAVTGVERLKAVLSGFGAEQATSNETAAVK